MIVCVCNRLTELDVREAARSGARTPEAAYEKLGCEPQCCCCLGYAQDLIDEERAKGPQLRVIGPAAA
jgi:bacterioferritin-associated ferredoxin